MGRYVVRIAEKYYDEDCDWRGYPIEKIRYTGEEYETTICPDSSYGVESGPDGWEIHTVIGGERPQTTYKQTSYDKDVERKGDFLYKKGSKQTILIECPYKNVKEVVIPNTVKRIEGFAFNECFDLTTIVIPSSVEEISSEAFIGIRAHRGSYYNSITITFANDVKTIPSGLIPSNTSKLGNMYTWQHLVKEIAIPDSVTKIEENAFKDMHLLSMTLPDSIEEIAEGAFSESSIYEVHISELCWMRFKDVMLEGCKKISAVKSGKKLLYFNESDFYLLRNCTDIGDEAFCHAEIMKAEKLMEGLSRLNDEYREKKIKERTELKISTSIQSIGKRAFMGCTVLVRVELPESLTYLGDEAFKDCVNLEEITLPKSLPWVGKNTFEGCSKLKTVLLPRKLYKRSKWKFPETIEFLFYDD